MNIPWTDSPLFEDLLVSRSPNELQEAQARAYRENGYLLLRGLLKPEDADRVRASLGPVFHTGESAASTTVYRVQDAWLECPEVRDLAVHPVVVDTLRFLYGRECVPFQTLNFSYGSEQAAHSDFVHFSCLPERFMCGVWVALEDVDENNGPLFYYPGSHRQPERDYFDLGLGNGFSSTATYSEYEKITARTLQSLGLKREELHVKKGDALIWSSNIFHGGSPIRQSGATRWSQVTHYYFESCVYYTPLHSNRTLGEYFLRRVINLRTMQFQTPSLNGAKISARQRSNGLYSLHVRGSATSGTVVKKMRFWLRARLGFLDGPVNLWWLKRRGAIKYER